ncbi:MAG: hypothetical protein ABEH88_06315 [Halobacteriales archaeon]
MARDTPVTDAEIEDAREAIRVQREEIREDLAAEGVDVTGWDEDPVSDSDPEPAESD